MAQFQKWWEIIGFWQGWIEQEIKETDRTYNNNLCLGFSFTLSGGLNYWNLIKYNPTCIG